VLAELGMIGMALGLAFWAWRADVFWFERHAHGLRCFRAQSDGDAARLWRDAGFAASALSLLLVRPLGVWVARQRVPGRGAVGRAALAFVSALVVTEFALRAWREAPARLETTPAPPTRRAPLYGWGLRPSTELASRIGARDVVYDVDADGNRARSVHAGPDRGRPTLFVAGESIALGLGVPYEDSFGALLEERLGVQVVNLAAQGYGSDQAYLRAREVLPEYAHPLAVVTVFVPEQVIRAEAEDRARLRVRADGTLTLVPPTPRWVREVRLRQLLQDLVPYHGDEPVEDIRAVVRASVALARGRDAFPLFVVTNFDCPCLDVDGRKPWLVRTLFEEQGVPHVQVEIPRSMRIDATEWHPNAAGHKKYADAIEAALRRASRI
jgi:hypothetical protein